MTLAIKFLLTTLLGVVLGTALTNSLNSSYNDRVDDMLEGYKKSQEQSELQLDSVTLLLDSFSIERAKTWAKEDSLYRVLDSSYIRMAILSSPKVDKNTKKETLEWIRLYNSSL